METPDIGNPTHFEQEKILQVQPFFDLVELVKPKPGMRVIDLGCGSGELTAWLHRKLEAHSTLGLVQTELELAQDRALNVPGLRFARGDILAFSDQFGTGWDLILSSTMLHWLPDHARLITRFYEALAPGGQLALQIPANHAHATHIVAQEVAQEELFCGVLRQNTPEPAVLKPEEYAGILFRLGSPAPHVREQVYVHALRDRTQVVDWVRPSLLAEYQSRLGPELFDVFVQRFRQRLESVLADTEPFFFPFKRILLWACKPGGSV